LEEAKDLFPTIKPVAQSGELVFAITVVVDGVEGAGSKSKIPYHAFIDLSNYPNIMPDIFILNHEDKNIKHINVFHPKLCPKLNKEYPFICLGNLRDELQKYRHIMAFLQGVKRILNNENYNSRAR
jgi:hypothetical protein